MPQSPIPVSNVDSGGNFSKLNITAATVVKAAPGRIRSVIILSAGSGSGAFTINDLATTAGAAAGNQIWTLPFANAAAGQVYVLNWKTAVGIAVTAVPGAGSPIIAVSYD